MPEEAPAAFPMEPIGKRGNLVSALTELLRKEIVDGRLQPGDQLPTEAALAARAGVSRTVVREAVASLRAGGLVETRQGAGAFVLSPGARLSRLPQVGRNEIEDILSVLELRLAVEVEAATLAAMRRTDEDIQHLDAALASLEAAQEKHDPGLGADVAFHHAIAMATHNPYFAPFLANLGESAMPRARLARNTAEPSGLGDYLGLVLNEHRAIRNAVLARDAALAAAAMRSHLAGSRTRYAAMLKEQDQN